MEYISLVSTLILTIPFLTFLSVKLLLEKEDARRYVQVMAAISLLAPAV